MATPIQFPAMLAEGKPRERDWTSISESICACCTSLMGATEAALLVRLNVAEVDTPATLAVTAYVPVWPLAVSAGAVATPLALVMAVAVADPLKAAVAPLPGAVKVTVTPASGLLPA